ncbi:TPA: hypothetical protein HA246_06945 [Candidatus Woesearchaeota archaeon]|nr:hypothetical protein [Candidatus Woesearchaeota archaeon]
MKVKMNIFLNAIDAFLIEYGKRHMSCRGSSSLLTVSTDIKQVLRYIQSKDLPNEELHLGNVFNFKIEES